jgi:hypothetical protein
LLVFPYADIKILVLLQILFRDPLMVIPFSGNVLRHYQIKHVILIYSSFSCSDF